MRRPTCFRALRNQAMEVVSVHKKEEEEEEENEISQLRQLLELTPKSVAANLITKRNNAQKQTNIKKSEKISFQSSKVRNLRKEEYS